MSKITSFIVSGVISGVLAASLVQPVLAAGVNDPGQSFIERLSAPAQPAPHSVSVGSHETPRDYYGLFEGHAAQQPQTLFQRTQGLGLAERAGLGETNRTSLPY